MGISKLQSATIFGFEAKIVDIEVAFVRGLPAFQISGLANQSVQEAKHRSSSALAAIGFQFPPLRVNINLSPSDLPKQGSHFDFGIALLIALHSLEIPPFLQETYFALGELGLDGKIKATESCYPILLDLSAHHYPHIIFVPKENLALYQQIPHLRLIGLANLQEALDLFASKSPLDVALYQNQLPFETLAIGGQTYYFMRDFKEDFRDIIGQSVAKRAALIAASGFHNILFEGSPGCGKSMIAHRMRYILPPLSEEEILKNAKMRLYESGSLQYSPLRSFRSPHASSSRAALLGSSIGNEFKPGEIALATQGILFLDELAHFPTLLLESLREPLENHRFTLSRAHLKIEYDTAFLLVCAQNPCPCGNLMSSVHECRCSDTALSRYKNKLSEPFWDRIDLYVPMQEGSQEHRVDSKTLFEQVLQAFCAQKNRAQARLNGHLHDSEVEQFCVLDEEASNILAQATQRFGLSHRANIKIKKVARTIADLEGCEVIAKPHVFEALSYRHR